MKKLFLFFYLSLFTLSLTGQNYQEITQGKVKREVRKFVQLLEEKVSKKNPPINTMMNTKGVVWIRDTIDINTSLGCGVKLIYYRNSNKTLYIDNFIDIGANGWSKNDPYDGIYSNNILFQAKFINWDKQTQKIYLKEYFEQIQIWKSMLKRVKK
ncbi:MAG: hypothetical protein WCW04_01050 [Candidatus Paceibacterota bacterium]